MKYKFPLAVSTWGKEEFIALRKVIKSKSFTMGKMVIKFENSFAKYVKSKYAIMVNSGSSANLIAIASLFYKKNNPLQHNDEVIVPAISWSTTYYPLLQYGLRLRFVDVDLDTLNYDLKKLKQAITSKTKLLIAVNLLGNSNDFDKIKKIISKKNILLFEDNCESLGAKYNKKKTGTFGIIGTHSTFFSHHISTMEGGVVVTDNKELYHIMLSLRSHGWTRNLPKKNLVYRKKHLDSFQDSFRFILPGYNLRPLELEASVGIEQLKKLPSFIKNRRQNAKIFIKLFKNHPNFIVQKEIGDSSWFGFSLIIRPNSKITRKQLIKLLTFSGIEFRPIVAGDFTQNEVIKYFDYDIPFELKNAKYIHDNGLFIGNNHILKEKEISSLFKLLSKK
jgi:CDP-4-dehydro-6-deoxyglucose reductase, E1